MTNRYTQKEIWLHKLLDCIYKEKGQEGIKELENMVEDHASKQDLFELHGQILDFVYDRTMQLALDKLIIYNRKMKGDE